MVSTSRATGRPDSEICGTTQYKIASTRVIGFNILLLQYVGVHGLVGDVGYMQVLSRHKVFVSAHHDNDQLYQDNFENLLVNRRDVQVSKSVHIGEAGPILHAEPLYKKIREGTFPKSIKLGPRAVAWKESEVQVWMDMRERLTRGENTCVDDKVKASGTNSPV